MTKYKTTKNKAGWKGKEYKQRKEKIKERQEHKQEQDKIQENYYYYGNKNERDRKAGHERKQDKVKKMIINYVL